MVTIHTETKITTQEDWANLLPRLTQGTDDAGKRLIEDAARWLQALPDAGTSPAGARWQCAAGMALLAADLQMDGESIAAALLLNAPVDQKTPVRAEVLRLIAEVAKLEKIGDLIAGTETGRRDGHSQVENLRQMLLAMVEDIRVVLIKLVERACALRTSIQSTDEAERVRIAREVQVLFAPLANRLGIWQIKWEMEDLAYRILEPANYQRIARLLDEKRLDRERYIAQVVANLQTELAAAGIPAEVSGRPKHIVSIINKMTRKHLAFEQLYDIRAIRILVQDVKDCYAVLGLVHHLWQPIAGEFDDYIAQPKSNDYRSLHTGVVGPENKALEVQIRTFDMHRHAELGMAAHWRYKEGASSGDEINHKIAWLRQILKWKDEVADGRELAELFKNELFQDRIYVLTPQGRVIDLAAGASPVDFAYHVHSDLGHRCRGAKVDGVIVPLNTPLKNGQRVEILTAKQGAPSRDWLNPSLGYLATSRARARVRHWFRYEHFDENVATGRETLDRELRRSGGSDISVDKLAARLGSAKGDEFLAAIGRGDISSHQLTATIQALLPQSVIGSSPGRALRNRKSGEDRRILIEGVSDLPVTMARCCHPSPPGSIVGYATQGRGITIHRYDCANVSRLGEERKQRLLAAHWDEDEEAGSCEIRVQAFDRHGLLRDVSDILAKEKISVIRVNTESRGDMAIMHFQVHGAGEEQLARVLEWLRRLPNVFEAIRTG
ncbi:MAG TPA: bifunctional (p)ppGpp synthetase/guanosine-3',5'-bis(diphosphate) 3'-pyrophosphohydrolase [Burkholderiales bacterium]|nr:bifunctional (p)ppGpp synthetase/guanosine-3',5'-bis(diphosphate) 3'-pyrophosphohydrolase [Burkholderiales bacterium]